MNLEWKSSSWKRWILAEVSPRDYSPVPYLRSRAVVTCSGGMWRCEITPYRDGQGVICRPANTYHRCKADAMAVATAHVRLS